MSGHVRHCGAVSPVLGGMTIELGVSEARINDHHKCSRFNDLSLGMGGLNWVRLKHSQDHPIAIYQDIFRCL